jgi:hypothetical protein
MKARFFCSVLACVAVLLMVSCDASTDTEQYSISGKAQKGPFIVGTSITLNELNANLGQTGKSFTTTIVSDDGSYALNNIELGSSLALLTANGYFFCEMYGELSNGPLSLQAVVDLSGKESVNINILTHLAKGRIETLVSEGKSFKEANEQASSELVEFMGADGSVTMDFENMDISEAEEFNAFLLSTSIIFQWWTGRLSDQQTQTAELTQLLTNVRTDFSDNGLVDNSELVTRLLFNISTFNLGDIRDHIETRYAELGQAVIIPDFEKYIGKFQFAHSPQLYTDFYYPAIANPMPDIVPDGVIPNVLVKADTLFEPNPYCVAAIIPISKTLKIRFIGQNMIIGGPVSGWEFISDYPDGFTLISQRHNELMTLLLHLENSGRATVEYYEDVLDAPTFSKEISWAPPPPDSLLLITN